MLGEEALEKDPVKFDVTVICPECGSGEAAVLAGRKSAKARIDCPECGPVREEVISYGGGVEVSRRD